MKKQILFILCSIFITVGFASAQTAKRTVTNLDLQKFKEKRLQAEKDLRENYARLGFPSPEELEKQRLADDEVRQKLSEKLRIERLQREQSELEQQFLQSQNNTEVYYVQGSNGSGYYPYYSGYYNYPRGNNYGRRYGQNGSYVTGGGYAIDGRYFPQFNNNRPGVRINPPGTRSNTRIWTPIRTRNPR
jgi:lysyl-tRNA synthetase class I